MVHMLEIISITEPLRSLIKEGKENGFNCNTNKVYKECISEDERSHEQ